MNKILGDDWSVLNCGSNGATAIRDVASYMPEKLKKVTAKFPYIKRGAYKKGLKSSPDIVVIMLGANDSKSILWNPEQYKKDMLLIISEYQKLSTNPQIYLCIPVTSFAKNQKSKWCVNEENLIEVRKIVRDISKELNLPIIDVESALKNRAMFSPDGVHPNKDGALLIAKKVAETLAH